MINLKKEFKNVSIRSVPIIKCDIHMDDYIVVLRIVLN